MFGVKSLKKVHFKYRAVTQTRVFSSSVCVSVQRNQKVHIVSRKGQQNGLAYYI